MTTGTWRVLASAALLSALALSVIGAPVLLTAPSAGAGTAPGNSIDLVSQTAWVRTTAGMHLQVAIHSALPDAELGLEVSLYTPATDRSYFEQSLSGDTEGGFAPISSDSPVLKLSTRGLLLPDGNASIDLPLAPTPGVPGRTQKAPANGALLTFPCAYDYQCPGVYPLQVSLENLENTAVLSSFMTYLILAPADAVSPLRFSLIFPIGSSAATSPAGAPTAAASDDEQEVEQLDTALADHPSASVSLALYPQLTDELATAAGRSVPKHPKTAEGKAQARETNEARQALTDTKQLLALRNVEAESETFTPVDLPSLPPASELRDQFATANEAFETLGAKPAAGQYVAAAPVTDGEVPELSSEGVKRIVVPSAGVAAVPQSSGWDYPVWAPFFVKGTEEVADASDYYLEQHLQPSSDPVLSANQLLADLALLYFVEQPPGNRGVTLLAPLGWRPSATFLNTVLSALGTSPIVRSDTLSQFFAQVPPGSDEIPPGDTTSPVLFRNLAAPAVPQADQLPASVIAGARMKIAALRAMMPDKPSRIAALNELVLMSETAQMSASSRFAYLGAPSTELNHEATQISLPDDRTITITSLSARIPISIYSKASVPLRIELGLSSAYLDFRHRDYVITLQPGNNAFEIPVSARTSGDFPLDLTALTPSGAFALGSGSLTIRSTAISGVAVALTAGAGAFLLLWWGRSAVKRRRTGKHARGARQSRLLVRPDATSTTSAT